MHDQTNNIHARPDTIIPGHSFSDPKVPNKAKVLIKETMISLMTNHIALEFWLRDFNLKNRFLNKNNFKHLLLGGY